MSRNDQMLVVTCANNKRHKRYVVDSVNDVCPACGELHPTDNYILYDSFGCIKMSNLVPKAERSV